MIITSLLLKKKIESMTKNKRRQYLIDCINKNYDISVLTVLDELSDEEQINNDICIMCDTSDFIKDKYQEICNNCGYSRHLQSNLKTFEKFDYITPSSNIVTIEKDGKKMKVNLSNIDLWIKDVDPLAIDTNKIIDNLNEIFNNRKSDVPPSVQNTAIKLWYNFNNLNKNLKYNKKAILALCTYYGITINSYKITMEELSLLYKVNVSDIKKTDETMKNVFKDTEYYKYFLSNVKNSCNINLNTEYKFKFDKIKNHLISNNIIKEPLKSQYYAGIVYFISNKLKSKQNNLYKYTLIELSTSCNVSAPTISKFSKNIEIFYNKNPDLYRNI